MLIILFFVMCAEPDKMFSKYCTYIHKSMIDIDTCVQDDLFPLKMTNSFRALVVAKEFLRSLEYE